ncbi:alkaline shock response membrane anchor protein AmaP [Goodfellowiella coeruleoviolacea]|uniref:Alkaline shock response membrane anchor protein AmaP n=1 Tax=Goodfellowiella coeruleoviolacea TaxID=334858 RepID=A0AAE3GET3_9PSEU|nr:alkaline shock response membrane anchor protein AmaP [Goodfellowiella coeruleoviolacea]MCP2166413.1 hypothetical protein [Goodfellowiella coeruleoviolacea]
MTRATRTTPAASVARPIAVERAVTLVVGLLGLLAGVAALVVGAGWLGHGRAARPVLDPLAMTWLAGHAALARVLAVLVGLVLLVLGLAVLVRAVRPERHPAFVLDRSPTDRLRVTPAAVAGAVRADAERVDGVARARARVVGSRDRPALRLVLWLREGTDLRRVWHALDARVLERARQALGVDQLPTAVRLELDTARRQRVR